MYNMRLLKAKDGISNIQDTLRVYMETVNLCKS